MSRRVGVYLTLLFFPLLVLSCRDGSTAPSSSAIHPFSLSFSVGDRFLYDGWVIDEYGYLVLTSKAMFVWHVRNADLTYQGQAHSTFIIDSVYLSRDSSAVVDSVYLAVGANGDLYQYGFLSRLAARLARRMQPKQWDRIAAFSLGSRGVWEVGTWDSAGVERVTGQIIAGQELFSVKINGVQTVFPGYRVELRSPSLSYSFALSDAPLAVLDISEEPRHGMKGSYRELKEIIAAK